jgi:phosphatidylglycerol:prolipoprotein diacylglycerol transferase
VGALGLALAGIPIGATLDASTPGIFAGIAVGRIGCFFAGCCAGRPTSGAWGLWSSDQRIGARRIPTQFLESGLNLFIAAFTLALVLTFGAGRGAALIAGLSMYTLGRQGILRLRVERPRSLRGSAITAAAAGVVLVLSIAYALSAG